MTMPSVADLQATPAGSPSLDQRIDTLRQAGHTWMPADMQTTLATSDTSNNEMVGLADHIKTTLAQSWDGFNEIHDDPVLHKQPTAALTLTRYLQASLGPLPVRQDDLHVIQSNLQKAGFGGNLAVSGVWDSGWNEAYNAWADDLRARQLAGDKPGSVSTATAGHSFWHALLPSHAVNAIVGFAKSLPADARSLVADVAGGASFIAHGPFQSSDQARQNIEGPTLAVEHAFGNRNLTAAQLEAEGIGRELQDVGTLLLLVPIAGQGSAALTAARGAFTEGVTKEAAQRTTGVIAKSLFGGLDRKTLENVGEDTTRASLRRGPLNSKVFTNIPLLRQVGPGVGRLADADGAYYKFRTLLATPYKYPIVRAAGDIGQRTMLTGAGLNLGATAEDKLGVGNDMSQSILNNRTLDWIDLSLSRLTGSPNEHMFTRAIDSLGFLLHGPLGATSASVAVGDKVQAVNDAMSNALGNVGLHGIWENAVTKATGQKTTIEDLQKTFGGPEYLDRFITMKTADLAASHYAQNTAQKEGLTFGGDTADAYRQRVGQLADEVWANPDLHIQAVRELLAQDHGEGLANRVAADIVATDPKAYARDAVAWMRAGDVLTDGVIRTGLAKYLFGPNGATVIHTAQDNFDHGLDMDSPVRLLQTTRRDYVHQVTTSLTRVRRQVDALRTDAARTVTQAEQAVADARSGGDPAALKAAVQTARQASKRQMQIERALDNGRLANLAVTSPRKSQSEWDRLVKDAQHLRTLIDQGTAPGQRRTLSDILDRGVNPDELYTNVNGPPRSVPDEVGSGDWMREHMPHPDGTLGLGRLDTKSAQQAAADITRFRTALDTNPDQQAVVEDMKNYAFREFGMDDRTLGLYDDNPAKLADILDEHAGRLASEVFLTPDAPAEVKQALARLQELGYRPMLGSHIGHLWDGSLPPITEVDGALARRRRIAGALGITPEQISPRTAGQDGSIRVLREVGKALQDPRVALPPRVTAETVMAVLRDEKLLEPQVRLPEYLAMSATRRLHKTGIAKLAQDRGLDLETAGKEYRQGLVRALQVRDIPRREFIRALTTPKEFSNGAQWVGVDERTANLVRRAVLRGYADRPGYIVGLSGIEDWARAGFSIGDKLAVTFPDAGWVQAATDLPNELFILRNRLRFTLSPFFDFRRITKQNVKMGIEGVTPVLNPMTHMLDAGTFDKAHKILDRVIGEPPIAGFDDADRYLYQQSVWGLYNSRHFEAYFAHQLAEAGKSDEEIRGAIRRVFEYGSARQGGRSALERTVNTVFFPFSFEKTLIRNVGSYMLDHPQQALLLTGAIAAYDDANKHSRVHQWVQDHLPILHDMQKLNAFAHGISPGEFGGINAPLMNLFLPQMWGKELDKKNLQRLLPIWNDFGTLMKDLNEQRKITQNAVLNARDYAMSFGAKRDPFDPYRPTVTSQAQYRKASAMKNAAILAWTPVLEWNLHHSNDAEKIRFPTDQRLPGMVQGEAVSRTTIGYLVQRWYPAYNPQQAANYAVDQQQKADQYVAKLKETDPVKARDYGVFIKLADQVAVKLRNGDYDTETAVQLMTQFRTAAANASETDPDFYKFYQDHYQYVLGPLEDVKA